jgi:hypothetical protein
MPRLDTLGIDGVEPFKNVFKRLAPLKSLHDLCIRRSRSHRELDGISVFRNLRDLSIEYFDDLRDVSALAGLPSLARLEVVGCKKLKITSAIETLIGLRSLRVSLCGDIGLDPLDQDRLAESVAELDLGSSRTDEIARRKRLQATRDEEKARDKAAQLRARALKGAATRKRNAANKAAKKGKAK